MRRSLGDERVKEGQRARLGRVIEARAAVTAARNTILGVAMPAGLTEMWPDLDTEERRSFLADGIDIVAIARGTGPARERVQIWTRDDPGVPRNLPGPGFFEMLVPITIVGLDDAPASSGIAAGE
jgi:hypothetical protein